MTSVATVSDAPAQPAGAFSFGETDAQFLGRDRLFGTLALGCLGDVPTARALAPEDARHLLVRTGFGATPAEIAELGPLDRAASVDRLLARMQREPLLPRPAFLAQGWPPYRDFPAMQEEQRQPFIQARRDEMQQLKGWWYAEMIATPTPLTERMTLFWHNHFVSAFEAVGYNVHRMWDQNALFRREAGGNFAKLLYAMLADPILLRYLDNQTNRKGRPNENLARELLELFTLGEGNYTETDIKEIARALTGRTIERTTDFGFRFVQAMHDEGGKSFLGAIGLNGDDVARVLLAQKRTAQFVTEKLWREFVDTRLPADAEIERVAAILRESGYEMKPALRALFLSDAFWAPANRGAIIKSPVSLIVGVHRDLGLPVVDLAALPVHGRRLGQDLFEPPNVKGWPGGTLWITPASLVARYDVLARLIANRTLVAPRPVPGRRDIALRLAADSWQGGPRFVLRINDNRVITTHEIDFGVDTARFGNMPDRLDWIWRVVRFPVEEPVWKVSVEFVNDARGTPGLLGLPHHPPTAKRVVMLWQGGGPSHVDLFDPKPDAHQPRRWPGHSRRAFAAGTRLSTMSSGYAKWPVVAPDQRLPEVRQGRHRDERDAAGHRRHRRRALPRAEHAHRGGEPRPGRDVFHDGRRRYRAGRAWGRGSIVWPRLRDRGSARVRRDDVERQGARPAASCSSITTGAAASCRVAIRACGFATPAIPVPYLANPDGVNRESRRALLDDLAAMNAAHLAAYGDPEIDTRIAQYEMAYPHAGERARSGGPIHRTQARA